MKYILIALLLTPNPSPASQTAKCDTDDSCIRYAIKHKQNPCDVYGGMSTKITMGLRCPGILTLQQAREARINAFHKGNVAKLCSLYRDLLTQAVMGDSEAIRDEAYKAEHMARTLKDDVGYVCD